MHTGFIHDNLFFTFIILYLFINLIKLTHIHLIALNEITKELETVALMIALCVRMIEVQLRTIWILCLPLELKYHEL
jgi:hypothetical protein